MSYQRGILVLLMQLQILLSLNFDLSSDHPFIPIVAYSTGKLTIPSNLPSPPLFFLLLDIIWMRLVPSPCWKHQAIKQNRNVIALVDKLAHPNTLRLQKRSTYPKRWKILEVLSEQQRKSTLKKFCFLKSCGHPCPQKIFLIKRRSNGFTKWFSLYYWVHLVYEKRCTELNCSLTVELVLTSPLRLVIYAYSAKIIFWGNGHPEKSFLVRFALALLILS
jgi:hypothetical protein